MFFSRKKRSKTTQSQQTSIMELQIMRENTKKNIKSLGRDIEDLIERGTTADTIDRKLLAIEYEEKQANLASETAHFDDICKLISQLNGVTEVRKRQDAFEHLVAVAESINTQEIIRNNDMMNVRRDMMREESAALDDVLKESRAQVSSLAVNNDFEAKVLAAQVRKLSSVSGGDIVSPSHASMELAH